MHLSLSLSIMRLGLGLLQKKGTGEISLREKESRLRLLMRECKRVVVAYSGGVDSSVVATVASQELGRKALVVIGVSPSLARSALIGAKDIAKNNGFFLKTMRIQEYQDDQYRQNSHNRCYFCKKALYTKLAHLCKQTGSFYVLDGTHQDDIAADRPGEIAARENGVRSLLQEVGIGKKEVRELALMMDLANHQKPADSCLASRIERGTFIHSRLLRQVEHAEDFLKQLGIQSVRVRYRPPGDAFVETTACGMDQLLAHREQILHRYKQLGFRELFLSCKELCR